MATISARVIEGPFFLSMKYSSCGIESQSSLPIKLVKTEKMINIDTLIYLNQQLDHEDSSSSTSFFWKQRMIIQMAISPHILSISFIPKEYEKSQILFLQKIDQVTKTKGFVNPYLSSEIQQKYEATLVVPPTYPINAQTLDESMRGLEGALHEEIGKILTYFLKDKNTTGLVLTYLAPSGNYDSRCWVKA